MVYSKDSCLHAKYQAKRLKRTKVMKLFLDELNFIRYLTNELITKINLRAITRCDFQLP